MVYLIRTRHSLYYVLFYSFLWPNCDLGHWKSQIKMHNYTSMSQCTVHPSTYTILFISNGSHNFISRNTLKDYYSEIPML